MSPKGRGPIRRGPKERLSTVFEVARSGREDFGVHGRRICWTSRNGGDKARGSRLKDESY
ncbi:BnaC09g13050D [Brassica napus]|uniref:BnaC09g13050D protein n=1 Tax=Brassica napus TaxID=3708 RepID=A0A078H350_BRANA|nr:BnaC09g13050D [Brassica napus]